MATENWNPYSGPVTGRVIVVDRHGNAIVAEPNQKVHTSPDGDFSRSSGTTESPRVIGWTDVDILAGVIHWLSNPMVTGRESPGQMAILICRSIQETSQHDEIYLQRHRARERR